MRATGYIALPLCLLLAGPALADVKDGVDAWSRGDFPAAIRQWQTPAARGDADALFNMAQAYKLGRGVPKDLGKAETMYRQAAEKGHARAADNYGVLLFQTGRQQQAMPWINASAERGEPRAMYVLGIAAFNGDFAQKDWVRAYALMTRAASAGLPQAVSSLTTMNETIPFDQRQQGAALAQDLERRTAEARGRELAAADLGSTLPAPAGEPLARAGVPTAPLRPQALPGPIEPVTLPPAQTDAPITAGADYANPVTLPRPTPAAAPRPAPRPAPKPTPKPAPKPPIVPSEAETPKGTYRIQLGAFGQKANADALWSRLRTRPDIAGHPRVDATGGAVTRLQATGYTEATATRTCAALKAAGESCLVVKP
ncbi:MAG: hypothetical protein RIS94_938 [Pseudomonadota bacterium]|jgi:cell division septation protein DedD